MYKKIFSSTKPKLVFMAGLFCAALVFAGTTYHAPKAFAACDKVNIIYCGLTGSDANGYISAVKNAYNAGKDSYGNSDIRTMLAWGGFTSSVIQTMNTNNTKVGTLYRNGDIYVDGRKVATSTWITARFSGGSGFYWVKDGVWKRLTTTSMADASDTVLISFDANGKAIAGIVVNCGNTLQFTATPPPASLSCDTLIATLRAGTQAIDTKLSATARNTSVNSYRIEWGDGSQNTYSTSTASHSYVKAGTYTVKGYVNANNFQNITSSACQKSVVIPPPVYACTGLTATTLDASQYKYHFTAGIKTQNAATFQTADFDFGDGNSSKGVKSTDGKTVTADYAYKKSGTYTITATLHFAANGSSQSVTCQTKVATIIPYGKCVELNASPSDGFTKFTFTATMDYGNGAVFKGADFDFGDGKTMTGVTPMASNAVSVTHTYDKAGNYQASAMLHFSIDGQDYTADTCYVKISPTEKPVPECRPGIPVGDSRCTPCQYDVNLTAQDVRCTPPMVEGATLPNTGAGNVVVLSLAAVVAGFLFYRHRVFEKHGRAFAAAENSRMPLPLGDPLSNHPLDGTPFEQPVRSTLRRRRQF